MTEKRKYPRQSVELRASMRIDGVDEPIDSQVKNLSIGGMFFFTEKKLPFGARVKVFIHFPDPTGTLEFPSVVRWSTSDGVGLQFGLIGAAETYAVTEAMREV